MASRNAQIEAERKTALAINKKGRGKGNGKKAAKEGTMGASAELRPNKKKKKLLWEYVLEPVYKPTYWDNAALSANERRPSRAKRIRHKSVCKDELDLSENKNMD